MMVYTMRYAAELRDPAAYFRDVKKTAIQADSLTLAKELIKRKSRKFDAAKFVDGYEVAVKELVDAKLKHAPIPRDEAPAPKRGKVINLMDALRNSVQSRSSDADDSEQRATKKSASRKGPVLVRSNASKSPKSAKTAHPRRKSA
jgi:DNA end-binding protein Ku